MLNSCVAEKKKPDESTIFVKATLKYITTLNQFLDIVLGACRDKMCKKSNVSIMMIKRAAS